MKPGKLIRVATLFLLGALLVSGCSSGAKKAQSSNPPDPSNSPTDTESQKPPFPSGLDYGSKILLAKDDLELEFLTIALASCKKAQTDGLIITDNENTTYFRPTEKSESTDWPFDQVTVEKGKASSGKFYNYLPSFFDPCDLEIQAHRAEPDAPVLEHKVDKMADNSYAWLQHHGGNSLEETVYQVTDGLITRYGRYNNLSVLVSYGPLNAEQLAFFDKVVE
jgi:hypothetical protein